MEYKPLSFKDHIKEIIKEQNISGHWECPNCGSVKKSKNII
jgi:hypothetical protein